MEKSGKFVGGAEKARRHARKRAREPVSRKGRGSKKTSLFKNLKPSQKFFYSLLASDTRNYINANNDGPIKSEETNDLGKGQKRVNSHYDRLISEICQRGNAPLPRKLSATYSDKNEFYAVRKALVLEEARCILSNELERLSKQGRWTMRLSLVSSDEQPKTGIPLLVFQKAQISTNFYHSRHSGTSPNTFSNSEMYHMKPGCVFELTYVGEYEPNHHGVRPSTNRNYEQLSVLATILPQNMNAQNGDGFSSTFTVMVFNKQYLYGKVSTNSLWDARPVTTLIGEQRQFEACDRGIKVAFMPTILGWEESSHIRFSDSDDTSSDEESTEKKKDGNEKTNSQNSIDDSNLSGEPPGYHSPAPSSLFSLPDLNHTQNIALLKFLKSNESTITLVQGPPGTGKTTFLVHAICRSLMQSAVESSDDTTLYTTKRILVTAPTNKAITVIASRLLDSLPKESSINVVMIGVEDKLVPTDEINTQYHKSNDDSFKISSLSSSLRSIFVYTWTDSMISIYRSLTEKLTSDTMYSNEIHQILDEVKNLENKIQRSIPRLAAQFSLLETSSMLVANLTSAIAISKHDDDHSDIIENYLKDSKMNLHTIIDNLSHLKSSEVVQELLFTANVIFCTLSSSGVSSMKMTSHVDDLFVDEAAAATEAEICIPFHLRPKRMLAVGDPMQLPATIISRRAMELGLDKSLHERLMSECNTDHIMLDIQYRMKPDISKFPSKQFYNGKIMNGSNVTRDDYESKTRILGGKPYSFLQISGKEQRAQSGSYYNDAEAQYIIKLLLVLKSSAKKHNSDEEWYSPEKVRIITFYQGQVQRIKTLLHKNNLGRVLVATVDSSQGCEADLVIVSFVRGNDKVGGSRQKAGFLTDDRRMNVALTRAKYQLICIGDGLGTLACSGDATLKAIVDDAKSRSLVGKVG